MIIHAKRANVYAMLEVTPGTAISDAALFVATNVICQGHDVTFKVTPEIVKRNPLTKSLQSIASEFGQKPASLSMKSRCYTSGTAGTAVNYALFLKACYASDTIVTTTSETFAQSPDQQTFLTIGIEYLSEDGTYAYRQVMKGVRGNAKLKADKIGAPLFWEWDFNGAYATAGGATTTPVSSITFQDEVANGIKFWQFQTPSGLFLRQVDSFELDFGNKIEMATDITDPSGLLYGTLAEQSPTLKIGFRVVTKATADDFANFVVGTLTSAGLTLGTVTGKILTFSTNTSAQIESLSSKAIGASAGFDVTLGLHRSVTGDASDAFSVVLK